MEVRTLFSVRCRLGTRSSARSRERPWDRQTCGAKACPSWNWLGVRVIDPPSISIFSSIVILSRIASTRLSTSVFDFVACAMPNCASSRRMIPTLNLRIHHRPLHGYFLRTFQTSVTLSAGTFLFDTRNIPVERQAASLPHAPPGSDAKIELVFTQSEGPTHVQIDAPEFAFLSSLGLEALVCSGSADRLRSSYELLAASFRGGTF
jgi:hypothetical protein